MTDIKSLMQQAQTQTTDSNAVYFDQPSSRSNVRADASLIDANDNNSVPFLTGNAGNVPRSDKMSGFYFLAGGTVVYAYAKGNPHGSALAGLLCSFGLLKLMSHI